MKKLERMEQQKKKDVEDDELLARPCPVYEWQLVQPMQRPLHLESLAFVVWLLQ